VVPAGGNIEPLPLLDRDLRNLGSGGSDYGLAEREDTICGRYTIRQRSSGIKAQSLLDMGVNITGTLHGQAILTLIMAFNNGILS
jgi:hypothetical protein